MPMSKQKRDFADSQSSANTLSAVMETVLGMQTLMASSYTRLLEFQHEAASLAIEETSAYLHELLRSMGMVAQVAWPHVHQQNEPRILRVTRAWFELASQTQTAMVQLLRESVLDRDRDMPRSFGPETDGFVERRRKAVVIDFPERRAASG